MIKHSFNPTHKDLALGMLLYIFHDVFDKYTTYQIHRKGDQLSMVDENVQNHTLKIGDKFKINDLCSSPYASEGNDFLKWLFVFDSKLIDIIFGDENVNTKTIELSYESDEHKFVFYVDSEKWHNIYINNDTLISCYGIYVNYVMGREDLMVTPLVKENVYVISIEGDLNQPILNMAYLKIRQCVFEDLFDEDILLSPSNIKHHLSTTIKHFEN